MKLIAGLAIATAVVIAVVVVERPAASPVQRHFDGDTQSVARDFSPISPRTARPTRAADDIPYDAPNAKSPVAPSNRVRSETATVVSAPPPANGGARPNTSVPDAVRAAPQTAEVAQPPKTTPALPPLPPLTTLLAAQCEQVNAALAREDQAQSSRQDLLVAYGRSSAASGQFELAAAAYAMFLDEFGIAHPYGPAVAERLATCLAPLDTSSAEVLHTPDGPRCRPMWLMDQPASDDRLRQAIGVYELLAEKAAQPEQRGKALFAQGWVHRALNQWAESTAAWDRCVAVSPDSAAAADASWLAIQNLTYTNEPAEAAERLRQFAAHLPDDPRARVARDQIESLEAESRRTAAWLVRPVESLEAEIAVRAPARQPYQVYTSVVHWLQHRHEHSALVEVCRWASQQTGWSQPEQIACRFDLAEALLRGAAKDASANKEVAGVLGEIAAMDGPVDSVAEAALRCARLLSEMGDHAAAATTLSDMAARCNENPQWEPNLLAELVPALARQGRQSEAQEALARLKRKYPAYEPLPTLAASNHTPTGGVP